MKGSPRRRRFSFRRSRARHLLRQIDPAPSSAASRAATANSAAPCRVKATSVVRIRLAWATPSGLDEPWRPSPVPPGFTVAGVSPNAPFAVIQDEAQILRPDVPPRSGARRRRKLIRNLSARSLASPATGPARLPRGSDRRSAPRSAGQGDLRPPAASIPRSPRC